MLAGIVADPLGFLVAFGAGILSFLSPCVLPLVPGYVSMVSGMSATELEAARHDAPDADAAPAGRGATAPGATGSAARADGPAAGAHGTTLVAAPPASADGGPTSLVPAAPAGARRAALWGIVLFVAGFTVVFVALGATASGLGHLLSTHKEALSRVAGAVIVALGLVLLVGALPERVWHRVGAGPAAAVARVIGERRFAVRPSALGAWAAPVMGMAFAFAWTPCIGPVLGAILALATTRSTVAGGAGLLLCYSLGLGVPFLLTGLAVDRLTAVSSRIRAGLGAVNLVAGVILVAFGVLLAAGQLPWLTTELETLMRAIGLGRLSTS